MLKIAAAALGSLALLIILGVAGAAGGLASLTGSGSGSTQASSTALEDIPSDMLALYIEAAETCPGLDWSILAAIGKIESDHGRSNLPGVTSGQNEAGAKGPMQFLQATFDAVVAEHDIPEGGADPPSPYNAHDAVYAAAFYLCDSGARDGNITDALYAYNHADWYVSQVLTQAEEYESATLGGDSTTSTAALQAINYAEGQLGLPYLWGGDGPDQGDAGFDCSGLTKAAYAAADITLPRTAQEQYDAGPHVTEDELQPGDLVFYGTPDNIHHVGIYIGDGEMIHAPRTGEVIQISPYRYEGDDYAGATRPAASQVVVSH